jgi:steroid 5-alpha reductase family enzyme
MLPAIAIAVFRSIALAGAWGQGQRSGRSGQVDAIWTVATGFACLAAVAVGTDHAPRGLLIGAYLFVWSARLAYYLWRRSAHGEDPRYAALKAQWGENAAWRMFLFLQVQAVASWPLALSAYVAAASPRPAPDWRDGLALAIFVVALAGEAIADAEMAAFKADPNNRGGICEKGLWAWSRHPNYFFEWLGWVGLPLAATDIGYAWGWLALLAPLQMYFLLVYVSGVPPLEESMRKSRGAAFEAYSRRVSLFWPRPPHAPPKLT